ncbi:MAG: helix-turn-helix domain-containing protein [Bacillota bacterium]
MAENPAAANSPGAELKSAREARGLSVHQVAVELHVSDAFISALERGEYSVLGQPVFVRGHLRNFARAVGLPDAHVLAAYDETQNKLTVPKLVTQHTVAAGGMHPRTREWSLRAATAAVVIVLLVLAVSWWERRPEETVGPPASVAQPVSTPNAVPVPAPGTASAPMASLTDLADSKPAAQAPVPAQKLAAIAAPAAPQPKPTSALPEATPRTAHIASGTPAPAPARAQQAVVGPGDAKNLTRVKFTLDAASWIEVYDNNGKRLYYDLEPAGGTLDLAGAGPLQVFLGNAPGVSVELNGASFDLKPYLRADNTARFKLGTAGNQ